MTKSWIRSPFSHLVFEDNPEGRTDYRNHIVEFMYVRRVEHMGGRPVEVLTPREIFQLKREYKEARRDLQSQMNWSDIQRWVRDNKDLFVRAPLLFADATKGLASFDRFKMLKAVWQRKLAGGHIEFGHQEFNQSLDGPGWLITARFEAPQSTAKKPFRPTSLFVGLTSYGLHVMDYTFEGIINGKACYELTIAMMSRDFTNLAMMRKLAGRIKGNALDFYETSVTHSG